MGATLSEPVKEKEVEEGEDENYEYAAVAMQGWRTDMEDAHLIRTGLRGDPTAGVFGVYDGHCGTEVSRFAARYMAGQLERTQGWMEGDVPRGLRDTFLRMDQALLHLETQPFLKGVAIRADKAAAQRVPSRPAEKWPEALRLCDEHMAQYPPEGLAQPNLDTSTLASKVALIVEARRRLGTAAGCTAVCAVVRDGVLTVANAGDSRCVLCRGGAALDMSSDHKPELPEECARIEAAGGFVRNGRTCGNLSLSRALGDFEFKRNGQVPASQQMITAMPDVRQEKLREEDEFLILACDGIWENLSSQQVVDFVKGQLEAGRSPAEAAAALCDHCLAPTLYSDAAQAQLRSSHEEAANEPAACSRQGDANSDEEVVTSADDNAKLEFARSRAEGSDTSAGSNLQQNVRAAMDSVDSTAAKASDSEGGSGSESADQGPQFQPTQALGEPPGIAAANGDAPSADIAPGAGPKPGGSGEGDPWTAFYAAMQLMKERPNASEEEMREAIAAHYNPEPGAGGDPAAVRAAAEHAALGGKVQAPRPMGPDSQEGYGCDNMSVVIVRLKDSIKQGTGAAGHQQTATAGSGGRGDVVASATRTLRSCGGQMPTWEAPMQRDFITPLHRGLIRSAGLHVTRPASVRSSACMGQRAGCSRAAAIMPRSAQLAARRLMHFRL